MKVKKISDWKGFKDNKRFTLNQLFCEMESIYSEIINGYEKDNTYEYRYGYLSNQVHFSAVKEESFNRIIEFSPEKDILKSVLGAASMELWTYIFVGCYFEIFVINDTFLKILNKINVIREQIRKFGY